MSIFLVEGGRRLEGTVRTHGAKNSVLPLLAASVLCGSPAAGCAGRDRPAEWKEKFYEKKDCRSFVMSGNGCRGIFRYGGCVAGLERQQRDMAGPQ